MIIYIITLKLNYMKKLILLTLTLFTLTSSAQLKKIEGVWTNEATEYVTVFFYHKGKIKKVKYIGPDRLASKIVNYGKNFVTTTIHNKKNNYKVVVKYEINKDDTLKVTFIGDYKGVLNYTRYNE